MNNNERGPIEFTEIDLGGDAGEGMRIPARDPAAVTPSKSITFSMESREQAFAEEALGRADEAGEPAPFVPFMSYWATYQQMTEAQRKWYFYWRSEVRQGRYHRTDLSYIFIYVYELIHQVGWTDPREGYKLLDEIWTAYRDKFPRLDHYLKEWSADFVLIHKLDIPLVHITQKAGSLLSHELMDLELVRLIQEKPLQIPMELLLILSDYDVQDSRFYVEEGQEDLDYHIPRIVSLAAGYLREKENDQWKELFTPDIPPKTTERYLFHRAVYDARLYGRLLPVTTIPIRNHAPLRSWLTQIIRYTENKLREHRGFKGRLRGVEIAPSIERLVELYLKRELTGRQDERPAIVIDSDKLASLQKDTEYVRSMLTVEEPGTTEEKDEETVAPANKSSAVHSVTSSEGSISDPVVAHSEESREPASVPEADPRLELGSGQVMDTAVSSDQEPAPVPETDYSPALLADDDHAASTDSRTSESVEATNADSAAWDTSGLDEEWARFAEMLAPYQLEALRVLTGSIPNADLDQVADRHGTMPGLIIDEINDLAMETIGDLVIDGDRIAEEYIDCFENLKG
ncbi:TerB N-terminal domain-containing protein [Paenibacillus sp. Y412MC10]|uniref:TerB N-terminal domain-containing protein n=1 Tax=Geobacillus sp. (strain Y412MC10) TaxID=481743 RepID=UPI0011AB6E26|nr:TerB N-terminal domain-containing protein [Paenibacillus sp. Y412MC10]